MYGLPVIDIIAIISYFIVVILIGIWSARRVNNQEDYFLAGRKFGRFIQTFAAFGQATSSESSVSTTVLVARNGVAGIWTVMSYVLTLPVYWITSVWYRRMRVLTLAEFFHERYQSKSISMFYSFISSIFFIILIALSFSAMTKTITGIMIKPVDKLSEVEYKEYQQAIALREMEQSDYSSLTSAQKQRLEELRLINPRLNYSYVDETILTWAVAIIVIIYGALGGLEAAFLTDTLQGVFIIILSLLLLPFIYVKMADIYGIDGIGGIIDVARSQLPQASFEIWNSPTAIDSQWYFVMTFAALMVLNVAVQPNQLTAVGSAKDEYTSRYGFTLGIYIKRVCTLIWGMTALLIVVLYGKIVKNPDYLWGYACKDLLGSSGIGLLGLMIACLMAALMSTADALMISGSGLLTINVVKPFWPSLGEKKYVSIGRVAGIVIIIGAAVISLSFKSFFDLLKFTISFNCMFVPIFWLGVKWRRGNRIASWSCIAVSILLFFLIPSILGLFSSVRTTEFLSRMTESTAIERTYIAREIDVEKREQEIKECRQLSETKKSQVICPESLKVGEKFTSTYVSPQRSIFWSQGLEVDSDGVVHGKGLINLELVIVDLLGVDLTKNSYSLNETIRLLIAILTPFVIYFTISIFTKPLDKTALDRFFVKMKTPVIGTHEEDYEQMLLSYQDPQRFDSNKMFPGTDWEFEKFTKTDIKGILISLVGAALLIGILWGSAELGKQ